MSSDAELLGSRLRLARHIVRSGRGAKLTLRNLRTGRYHRLNPTALRMLTVVDSSLTVQAAAATLAEEYDQDRNVVEADLLQLCRDLLTRQVLVAAGPPDGADRRAPA